MTIGNFTSVYTGYVLVLTNDTNCTQFNNGTFLNYDTMSTIKGTQVFYEPINPIPILINYGRVFWPLLLNPYTASFIGAFTAGFVIGCYYWPKYLNEKNAYNVQMTVSSSAFGPGSSYRPGHGYRTRSQPIAYPRHSPPPVYPYTYWGPNPDGSWGLITSTTTGNPDELKNKLITDAYNQKKAQELAKIAGIIDAYLKNNNDLDREISQNRAKMIDIEHQYSSAGIPPKDPDWSDWLDEILNGKNKLGDDKYDEAGEVISYLMRDAGKNFRTAKELCKAGDIKGAAYIAAGLTETYMAVMVMLKFPL